MKKSIRTIIAMLLCFIALFTNVSKGVAKENYDSILQKIGTPQTVIDEMDEGYKEYICNNLEPDESYQSYEVQDVGTSSGMMSRAVSSLTSSDMKVSIFASGVKLNGEKCVKLYPSFAWKKSANLYNDTFAFALYSGWDCIPDINASLTVNAINSNGVVQQTRTLTPSDAAESGYAFQFPKECKKLPGGGYYEGYAYFYARRKKSSATKAISIKYVHDSSPSNSVSYGISIGPASISLSSSSSKLQVFAKNMSFSYSYSTK